MSISEKLFETAIKDLESVEILYNSKHYNIAVFQLQQCVEKLVKSFGIKTNSIKPEEIVRKISHLPHKVFVRLYENQLEELGNKAKPPMLLPNMVPPHQRDKTELFKQIERTKILHSKILTGAQINRNGIIEEDKLKAFILGGKDLEIIKIDEVKVFKEIEDDFIKTNEHFIEYFKYDENIKKISKLFIEDSKEIAKQKLELRKKEIIRERKYGYVEYVWINLCLITFPHEQSTRYPSITSGVSPQELYNEDSIIVKYLPELIMMLKKSIKNFKEVYEK